MSHSVAALCGSYRAGSLNQKLLDNVIALGPEYGLVVAQVRQIEEFPMYSQDTPEPLAVAGAKREIQASDCLLLVSPEYNFGVPGYLKNAIDWLSRPAMNNPTLAGRPMALMGASSGYMGTMRGQLAWRQMWHFFKAPVFSGAEMTVSFGEQAFGDVGELKEPYSDVLATYLERLSHWLDQKPK